jgi:hypothetical protein
VSGVVSTGGLVLLGTSLLVVAGGMLMCELREARSRLDGRWFAVETPRLTAPPPRRKRHAEEARLGRALAIERRRSRRAHRQERRAQRLLVMARCLVGAGRVEEVAARAAKAVLDDFGAETATVFAVQSGRPCLLAEAARRDVQPPVVHFLDAGELIPQVAGPEPGAAPDGPRVVSCLPLRNERRRTVGFLIVGHAAGRRPAGIEAYAAFVGQLLAVELERHDGAVGLEAVLGAAA